MCQKGSTSYYPAKRKELKKKYKAYISSWDDNVESWSYLNVPKKIIKYEDLLFDTENTLLKLIISLGAALCITDVLGIRCGNSFFILSIHE